MSSNIVALMAHIRLRVPIAQAFGLRGSFQRSPSLALKRWCCKRLQCIFPARTTACGCVSARRMGADTLLHGVARQTRFEAEPTRRQSTSSYEEEHTRRHAGEAATLVAHPI